MKVVKRDGSIVDFDRSKIEKAIDKAANAVRTSCPLYSFSAHALAIEVESILKEMFDSFTNVHVGVEEIQDIVEKALVRHNCYEVAKAYIIYRERRMMVRESDPLMKLFGDLTFKDSVEVDAKRENANIDANTAMGTMLKYGTTAANYYVDNYILPKHIAKAHIDGDIHIHDKDFYLLTETCCQIDLLKLLKDGFQAGHGQIREPTSILTAAALACIAIQANQNEMHGGQAIPHFDFAMAPYVQKTYEKEYKEAYDTYVEFKDTNEFVDGYAHIIAMAKTERATHQAMEALVHNLNTMHSRAGAQVPFSSLNYGTDTSWQGRMVIKNLLLATEEGLGGGETPIFPVQIFKVKEGVNYEEGTPNHDLFLRAIEVSAKRLFPNFSFLDAPFNKEFYKPNDWNSEVAYMGCRTRVMANVYKDHEVTCGRGNLSFTTINLPRIALETHCSIDAFLERLDDVMDLVIEQLLHRFKIQCNRKVKNYPFLMGNGIWIDSDKLDWEDKVEPVLVHGTLTIGFIGLAEALIAMMGKHHGESEDAQKIGLSIIRFMRDKCDDASEKYFLNFSLLATPAEGLSGRFVKLDRERYGVIEGVTDKDYYTNSFHVPVYYKIKAHKKIEIEAPYHAMTNGGHITYVELDGNTANNLKACEKIIQYMHDKGIGYGSFNHPVDRDPLCGYVGVIGDTCPRCGRKEGEAIPVEKLEELRRKYPNVPKV